jgi:hypothetical protein
MHPASCVFVFAVKLMWAPNARSNAVPPNSITRVLNMFCTWCVAPSEFVSLLDAIEESVSELQCLSGIVDVLLVGGAMANLGWRHSVVDRRDVQQMYCLQNHLDLHVPARFSPKHCVEHPILLKEVCHRGVVGCTEIG